MTGPGYKEPPEVKAFRPQAALRFYKQMGKEQIYDLQSKVFAALGGKALRMTPGVADLDFVKNVRDAQQAMGFRPRACDGRWADKHDKKFQEVADSRKLELTSQFRVYYPLTVAGVSAVPSIRLAEEKQKTKPLPRIETEKPYIIRVTTRPGNYLVVMTSNKSHKELKPEEMQRMYTLAVKNGSIYEEQEKGVWAKFKLPKGQTETFLGKQQTIVFHSEDLISANLQKQKKERGKQSRKRTG